MVDSVNGMPAGCAARQARISPSPCCMPVSPTGASASGSAAGSPRIVVVVAARGHVEQDALAQLDALEIGAVGAQRLLGIGAGVGIIEEGARHLAVGGLPQILDAGHGFHAAFPPTGGFVFDSTKSAACRQLGRNADPRRSLFLGRSPLSAPDIEPVEEGDGMDDRSHPDSDRTQRRGCGNEATEEARRRRSRGAGGDFSGLRPGCGHPAAVERTRQL